MRMSLTRFFALIILALVVLLIAVEFGPAVVSGRELSLSDQRPAPEFTLTPLRSI
jgi:hypothetical protein